MKEFVFTYPTAVYFGEGAAKKHLKALVAKYGKRVLLAYGGGSIKKNGIYDELKGLLTEAGKEVVDFPVSCPTPPTLRCRKGLSGSASAVWISSLRWAAAAS